MVVFLLSRIILNVPLEHQFQSMKQWTNIYKHIPFLTTGNEFPHQLHENQSLPTSGAALNDPISFIEVIIQTGPYSGFPPALNALTIAEEVLG